MEDLDKAAEYVARDSATYAKAFVRRVFESAHSLTQFAERGTVVDELGDENIRERFVSGYRLVYLIRGEVIHILGVIHAARDFAAAWNERQRPR